MQRGTLMGRQNKTTSPGGTITRNVLDVRGRVAGHLGRHQRHRRHRRRPDRQRRLGQQHGPGRPASSSTPTATSTQVDPVRRCQHDPHDQLRLRLARSPGDDHHQRRHDHATSPKTRWTTWAASIQVDRYYTRSVASANLIARSATSFDNLGRVYQTQTYAVDPTSGTVGIALTDNTWYDAAGNAIKSLPGRLESLHQDRLRWPGPRGRHATSATTRPRPATPTCPLRRPTTRSSSRPKPPSIRRAT